MVNRIENEKQARLAQIECMKLEQLLARWKPDRDKQSSLDYAVEKSYRKQAIKKLKKLRRELRKYEGRTKALTEINLKQPTVSQVGAMDAKKLSQLAREKETAFIYEDYQPIMALISYQEYRKLQYFKSLQQR